MQDSPLRDLPIHGEAAGGALDSALAAVWDGAVEEDGVGERPDGTSAIVCQPILRLLCTAGGTILNRKTSQHS